MPNHALTADSRVKLMLSVARAPLDQFFVDVAIYLGPETRVEELSLTLARYLGSLTGDSYGQQPDIAYTLHCERLGRLAPHDCVLDTGLRSGDMLTLSSGMRFTSKPPSSEHGEASADAVVDLVVHAGPKAGQLISLPPGRYVLGRNPKCEGEIVLGDPSISRRHLQLDVSPDSVWISDLDSSNGFSVEGRIPESSLRLPFDGSTQIEVGRSVIAFQKATSHAPGTGTIRDGETLFNRQPRFVEPYHAPRLTLEQAPGEVSFGRLQLAGIFLPIAGGVSSAAIFGEWKLLLSTALSPLTLLWTYVAELRHGRQIFHRSMDHYKQHLDRLGEELEQAKVSECAARRSASPDAVELAARALQIRPELWERRATDEDFLSLRLGIADLPAEFTVETPSQNDSTPERSKQLLETYGTVPMVPVSVTLPQRGSLGLIGPDRRVDGLGLWLALQAAILHSPCELSIAAAIDPDQRVQWDWLKWLPHTRSDLSPLAGSHLADDMPATRDLISRISNLVSERHRGSSAPYERQGAPALLFFLDEDLAEERGMVEDILARGPTVGVHTVWLGHLQRGLPGECRSIAVLDNGVARLTLIHAGSEQRILDVTADAVEHDFALNISRSIASFRDIGARGTAVPAHTSENLGGSGSSKPHDGIFGAEEDCAVTISPFTWGASLTPPRDFFSQDRSINRDLALGFTSPQEAPES